MLALCRGRRPAGTSEQQQIPTESQLTHILEPPGLGGIAYARPVEQRGAAAGSQQAAGDEQRRPLRQPGIEEPANRPRAPLDEDGLYVQAREIGQHLSQVQESIRVAFCIGPTKRPETV